MWRYKGGIDPEIYEAKFGRERARERAVNRMVDRASTGGMSTSMRKRETSIDDKRGWI